MTQPVVPPVYKGKSASYYRKLYGSALGDIMAIANRPITPAQTKAVTKTNPKFDVNKFLFVDQPGKYNTIADTYKAAQGDTVAAGRLKGRSVKNMSPEFQKLYNQVVKSEQKAGIDDGSHNPSLWDRAMDVLSRFTYGVANSYTKEADQNPNDFWKFVPVISMFNGGAMSPEHLSDFWDGFSGREKVTFSDVLAKTHPELDGVGKFITGLALDIAMDPTTYVGVGAVKKGVQGTNEGFRLLTGSKLTRAAAKDVEDVGVLFSGRDNAVIDAILKDEKVSEGVRESMRQEIHRSLPVDDPNLTDLIKSAPLNTAEDLNELFRQITAVARDGGAIHARAMNNSKAMLSGFRQGIEASLAEYFKMQQVTKAMKAGTFISPERASLVKKIEFAKSDLAPQQIKEYLTLRDQYSALASEKSYFLHIGDEAGVKRSDEALAEIKGQISKLTDEVPIDLGDDLTRQGVIKFLKTNDKEVKRLESEIDAVSKQIDGMAKPLIRPGSTPMKPRTAAMTKPHNPENADRLRELIRQRTALQGELKSRYAEGITRHINDKLLPKAARGRKAKSSSNRTLLKKLHDVAEGSGKTVVQGPIAVVAKGGKKAAATDSRISNEVVKSTHQELAYRLGEFLAERRSKMTYDQWNKAQKQFDGVSGKDFYTLQFKKRLIDEYTKMTKGKTNAALVHDLSTLEEGTLVATRPLASNGRIPAMLTSEVSPEAIAKLEKTNAQMMSDFTKIAGIEASKYADQVTTDALATLIQFSKQDSRAALGFRLGFMGSGKMLFAITAPKTADVLLKKMDAGIVHTTVQAFNKTFVSSSGIKSPELRALRAQEVGRANVVIEYTAENLKGIFRGTSKAQRSEITEALRLGKPRVSVSNPELYDGVSKALTDLSKKFTANAYPMLADETLNLMDDVVRFLPKEFRPKQGRALKAAVGDYSDGSKEWILRTLEDLDVEKLGIDRAIWHLEIATEKALSRKATLQIVRENFGIRRYYDIEHKLQDPITKQLEELPPELRYKPYSHLDQKSHYGDEVLFSPEVHRDLEKIDQLMLGRDHQFLDYMDDITRVWKRTITIYNPGYHARNTFGDVFVSWLDGVTGLKGVQSHHMAMKTLKAMGRIEPNSPIAAAMKQPRMSDAYQGIKKSIGDNSKAATEVLFKINGKAYTTGDIWALYIQHGLKQGFVSTEFEQAMGKAASTGASAKLGKVQDKITHMSETREDIFRMAHFIHVIRTSGIKNMDKAAAEAAERVRKFHFDYNDFTPAERMGIARMIPFYKWTRKALPLMIEMLFAQPGKMGLYNKVMANAQDAIGMGGQGYGTGGDEIIPEWVRTSNYFALGAVGGESLYAKMALPMSDALTTAGNPITSFTQMMHPGLQAAVEISQQHVIGSGDVGAPIDNNIKYAASYTPQTNQLWKQFDSYTQGKGINMPALAAFFSGLGINVNTEQQMTGELIRRRELAMRALKGQENAK